MAGIVAGTPGTTHLGPVARPLRPRDAFSRVPVPSSDAGSAAAFHVGHRAARESAIGRFVSARRRVSADLRRAPPARAATAAARAGRAYAEPDGARPRSVHAAHRLLAHGVDGARALHGRGRDGDAA